MSFKIYFKSNVDVSLRNIKYFWKLYFLKGRVTAVKLHGCDVTKETWRRFSTEDVLPDL